MELHEQSRASPCLELSVVIPCWNGATRISSTLDSLALQTIGFDKFDVVVIDDGSDDGTAGVVAGWSAQFPAMEVTCVRRPHGGVNAARNAGVSSTRGRVVAFVDDDEAAPSDYLERAIGLLHQTSSVSGVGGPARLIGDAPFRVCSTCSIGEASLPIDGRAHATRLLGGNMVIRRDTFDDVGLFDPQISGRGDETEWFARADREFLYDESLFVWHRRDHMSWRSLLVTGYRQGKSVPLMHERLGDHSWRPSVIKLGRYFGHAVRRRCTKGLLQASRELGAFVAWSRRGIRRSVRKGHH
jgi:glycosyltransferase involved in cell wall biosynthesis